MAAATENLQHVSRPSRRGRNDSAYGFRMHTAGGTSRYSREPRPTCRSTISESHLPTASEPRRGGSEGLRKASWCSSFGAEQFEKAWRCHAFIGQALLRIMFNGGSSHVQFGSGRPSLGPAKDITKTSPPCQLLEGRPPTEDADEAAHQHEQQHQSGGGQLGGVRCTPTWSQHLRGCGCFRHSAETSGSRPRLCRPGHAAARLVGGNP